MARRSMQEKEPRLWSERFLGYQAKWFALPIMGLFVFLQLLTHDGGIYTQVAHGGDASALGQLYFPNWSNDEGTQIARMTLVGMIVLGAVAIFIRYAKWHYANHGIALD